MGPHGKQLGTNIAGAATTVVKVGRGHLVGIVVNKAVLSGVITIYDGISASGTKLATITHPGTLVQTNYYLPYGIDVGAGICVVTSAADDITVVYA